MTIKEIVKIYLVTHKYNGLQNSDEECSCWLDDFMPCHGDFPCSCTDCEPAYKEKKNDN